MALKRTIKRNIEQSATSLSKAFEEFITEKEAKNLSAPTIKNYQVTFRMFCEFHDLNEDAPIAYITQAHFYKWITALKQNGVKHTSINHYLRDCRAFFYWCMNADRKYIEKPFKIEMIRGQEETVKHFTYEELDWLLGKPNKTDEFVVWRTWAIVNWVLATGNRAATICEVKMGDVDYGRKEIVLAHTKNKKAQIIPLSSSLASVLKEYINLWRSRANEGDWLFPNVGEEQLTTNALRHSFARYCRSKGINKSNIHGLRHNFAKRWLENDGNMFKLQKILGHSTLEMTRRYVRLFSDDIKEDYDKFSPLDSIKRGNKRTQIVKRNN